jgi:cytochrome c oxidase subunit 4
MSDHGPSLKTYVAVFAALLVLTLVTYSAAYMNFGSHTLNVVVALGIAVTKATLVVLFFMHVKYSPTLTKLLVAASFIWLALLILGTLHDYYSPNLAGEMQPASLSRE